MMWSSLERKADSIEARGASHAEKLSALARAREAGQVGAGFPPTFLLTVLMTLATAWSALSPFGPSLDPDAATRPAELRKYIEDAVGLLVHAQS